jgi:hypothetical protein
MCFDLAVTVRYCRFGHRCRCPADFIAVCRAVCWWNFSLTYTCGGSWYPMVPSDYPVVPDFDSFMPQL